MKKDKKSKYWFVRKEYGWGWRPSSWQGWLTLIAWIISFITIFLNTDKYSHSASDTFYKSIIPLIIVTAMMWIVCWIKGQSPKWQWGKK